jgi:hypothetical protein
VEGGVYKHLNRLMEYNFIILEINERLDLDKVVSVAKTLKDARSNKEILKQQNPLRYYKIYMEMGLNG